jgi:hypothetical protein
MATQQINDAAVEQLRRYGYLLPVPEASRRVEPQVAQSDVSGAVTTYQVRHGLRVTGELDAETRAHLALSRCSWVDDPDAPWRQRVDVMQPIIQGELAMAATDVGWFLTPIPMSAPPSANVDQAIATAFLMWSSVTPIRFVRQPQALMARVTVSFALIDGTGGRLGETFQGGPMRLDATERWSVSTPPSPGANADVLTIALHELGHAVGIGDIPDPSAVMHGFFGSGAAVVRRAFTPSDLQAITARFGT